MTAADRRKLNRDAGFSLLELLIAVVILAIIVIPLLNLFLSSNKINIKSRQTLRATTAAQDIMEGLKAYNIKEIQSQFHDPASGFYVIDSRLIKGDIEEVAALEVDGLGNPADGLYVFSMKELNLQGSKFDAKIEVDGRGYMDPTRFSCTTTPASHIYSPTFFSGEKCTVCGEFKNAARKHDGIFNDAALADARSIDKKNGTFVETEKIRQAILASVFKDSSMAAVFGDSAMETDIKNRLKKIGLSETVPYGEPYSELEEAYQKLQLSKKPDGVSFKGVPLFFDQVSREITIELAEGLEKDENGRKKVDMVVTEKYTFDLHYTPGPPEKGRVVTTGDVDSGILIGDPSVDPTKALSCGSITRMVEPDPVTGTDVEKINVNLFYYPLYGPSGKVKNDKIIIKNKSGIDLNLLIAKQRHETIDSSTGLPVLSDPEYMTDPQLMAAEQTYHVDVEIQDASGAAMDNDKFTLKTNLGLNLAGEKYVSGSPSPGAAVEIPAQFTVNGTHMDLSGSSGMNIFTLDGVRSPMGNSAASDEITELIYDVEVGVYEEGAAAAGFPNDMRMVVIEGSMTN